jgi:hypothetical protein
MNLRCALGIHRFGRKQYYIQRMLADGVTIKHEEWCDRCNLKKTTITRNKKVIARIIEVKD